MQTSEIARRLGTPLMPHQQFVADVGLEVDESGGLAFDEIVMVIHRQSGKTTLVLAKTLQRLISMVRTHGPQRSTYVAQKRLSGRSKFEKDFAQALRRARPSFVEVEHARQRPVKSTQWKLSLNNGSENFEFGTGSYWQLGVPDESGGHGDTLDDATIDEARFHEDDTVEEGLRPSQITRRDAQLWVLSTAGKARAFYLWRKILAGRAACESGVHGRVAYFEWSAPDDVDTIAGWSDPDVWRACMPALGGSMTVAKVQSEWERALRGGQDGIDTFRRAYLNQWPEVPVLPEFAGEEWVLPKPLWLAARSDRSGPVEPFRFALDVSVDQAWASFAMAAPSALGGTHVEVVDHREGTSWVAARALELQGRWGGAPIVFAASSPAASLAGDLEAAGVELLEVSTADHAKACGSLLNAVLEGTVRHVGQGPLDAAVAGARKSEAGDSWRWSRKASSVDISPLVAVTLALWSLGQPDPGSLYEGRGMATLG